MRKLECPDAADCTDTTSGAKLPLFVYDAQGRLAAEYGPSTETGTKYLTVDHLGSTRFVTKADGTVDRNYDYLPFGEEIGNGWAARDATFGSGVYPSDPVVPSQKFTGKERDAETGLDYFGARYFSGPQGRFTSPDPLMASARASNPQTWNRYAYALNNPLRYVDPDGLEVPEDCAKDQKCTIVVKVNVIYDQTVKPSRLECHTERRGRCLRS